MNPWNKISEVGYPQLNEKEFHEGYPQRLVLTITKQHDIKLLCWNFMEMCWDDESGDDYMYDKEYVEYWMDIPTAPEIIDV